MSMVRHGSPAAWQPGEWSGRTIDSQARTAKVIVSDPDALAALDKNPSNPVDQAALRRDHVVIGSELRELSCRLRG